MNGKRRLRLMLIHLLVLLGAVAGVNVLVDPYDAPSYYASTVERVRRAPPVATSAARP